MEKFLKSIGWAKVAEPKEAMVEDKVEKQENNLSHKAQEVLKKYPAEVVEIHNKFNNEAEKLFQEAKEVIGKISIEPQIENKGKLAQKFGFYGIKEVQEVNNIEREKSKHSKIIETVAEARRYIPDYKWIPETSVKRICQEYNLVFGSSSQYIGFLPNKNLLEIEEFVNKHKNKFWGSQVHSIYEGIGSEPELTFHEEKPEKDYDEGRGYFRMSLNFTKDLNICAPIKDMNTLGAEIKDGYKLHVPDPIVLCRRDFNGIEGYYIVTAWGDEASDPEVINNR